MKSLLIILLSGVALFSLMACKPSMSTTESASMNQPEQTITIYDHITKVERGTILESVKVEAIKTLIDQRKKVLLKRLPIFKYEVKMVSKGKNVVWLFSKEGIIQRKGGKESELYQVNDPNMIAKHIK